MLAKKFLASAANAKYTLISIVLVTNAFVWYYFVIEMLKAIVNTAQIDQSTTLLIWVLHFGGMSFSALLGASLAKKVKDRTRFILLWMLSGVILSVISIGMNLTYIPNILALSLLFGVSLGLGMPICMGYFTQNVTVEKRGRVGGIIFLLSGLTIVVLGIAAGADIGLQTIILSGWRVFGFVIFLVFLKFWPLKEIVEQSKPVTYKSLLNQRSFLLYFIPWILFSLITDLTIPIQTNIIQTMQANAVNIPSAEYLRSVENIFTAVFAIIGGFLTDFIGRKRMSIVGFALLGLAYSVLGIYPENPFSWYFYTVVDGISWGILFVIFVITIWADISHDSPSEKYYALGVLPFFISYFLRLIIGSDIAAAIPNEAIFSFTAFFLFLAVLPLVYAPETLPEKHIKDRELKGYLEKAQKVKEKYS